MLYLKHTRISILLAPRKKYKELITCQKFSLLRASDSFIKTNRATELLTHLFLHNSLIYSFHNEDLFRFQEKEKKILSANHHKESSPELHYTITLLEQFSMAIAKISLYKQAQRSFY